MSIRKESYDISEKTGFLPERSNDIDLPPKFNPWKDIMDNYHDLVKSNEFCKRVEALPVLQTASLADDHLLKKAYSILTLLSHRYLIEGEGIGKKPTTKNVLPRSLAIPWVEVSKSLGVNPVVTYASVVLYNYCLIDDEGPLTADNIKMLHTFTGTRSEEWFYIGSVLVEIEAIEGLNAIEAAFIAIENGDIDGLTKLMIKIHESLEKMAAALKKMYDECDKTIFCDLIRHFFNGTIDETFFGEGGVKFEGVPEKHLFQGASAGQSSTLPTFDAFLGIVQENAYFMKQRGYMPKRHREFITEISQMPSVREYIAATKNPDLIGAYNKCIGSIASFRNGHYTLVMDYIGNAAGTGGTEKVESLLLSAKTKSETYYI